MLRLMGLLLAVALLVAIATLAHSYDVQNVSPPPVQVEGLWFDDDSWSAIYMPDSTVTCRWKDGDLRCISVPPGSVLLIPQEAK